VETRCIWESPGISTTTHHHHHHHQLMHLEKSITTYVGAFSFNFCSLSAVLRINVLRILTWCQSSLQGKNHAAWKPTSFQDHRVRRRWIYGVNNTCRSNDLIFCFSLRTQCKIMTKYVRRISIIRKDCFKLTCTYSLFVGTDTHTHARAVFDLYLWSMSRIVEKQLPRNGLTVRC